jgi:UDP-glucuronate 4-epimerase
MFPFAIYSIRIAGETINLGHDSPVEMREIISRLENVLGTKAVIQRHPERPEDLPATWADLEKARRLLDYQLHVTLNEGIPEYVDWFVRCHST